MSVVSLGGDGLNGVMASARCWVLGYFVTGLDAIDLDGSAMLW